MSAYRFRVSCVFGTGEYRFFYSCFVGLFEFSPAITAHGDAFEFMCFFVLCLIAPEFFFLCVCVGVYTGPDKKKGSGFHKRTGCACIKGEFFRWFGFEPTDRTHAANGIGMIYASMQHAINTSVCDRI